MAIGGKTTLIDLCEVVQAWPICARDEDGYLITTHCQMPSGSLIKLRARAVGNNEWIVSDNGAACDEAISSGMEKMKFGLNVRRAIRSKGLTFIDGRIESPKIQPSTLYAATVVVANAARDVADALLAMRGGEDEFDLQKRTRKLLVTKFHSWVLSKPVSVVGASERQHKFDNALDLPNGKRVLIDTVKHQGNSINSAVVSNLDVRRTENPNLLQRIVFDPNDSWNVEEIALLEVGAVPVALPKLGDAIQGLAA